MAISFAPQNIMHKSFDNSFIVSKNDYHDELVLKCKEFKFVILIFTKFIEKRIIIFTV